MAGAPWSHQTSGGGAARLQGAAMTESVVRWQAGDVVAERYRIEACIARGMAHIFRAYDLENQRLVAIKLLSETAAASEEMRDRIVREAELLVHFKHPGVVRAENVGAGPDGSFYFVMELLEGEPLSTYLSREGSMSAELALPLMLQAARALEAVHQQGIVHRDVKPGNCFLCGPIGNPRRIKLLDFGLAKLPGHTPSTAPVVLGTLEYMAPEQAVGDPTVVRADVYSLGAVLFRVLTGELPFDVNAQASLLAHQLLSAAPPPSWLNEGLSEHVDRVVLTALKKHPSNRYADMQALADDLERILEGSAALGCASLREPDRYEPRSEMGRQAIALLGRRHGHDRLLELQGSELALPELSTA